MAYKLNERAEYQSDADWKLYLMAKSEFAKNGSLPVLKNEKRKKINQGSGKIAILPKHSAEWLAWYAYRKEKGLSVAYMDKADVFTVPQRFPPVEG